VVAGIVEYGEVGMPAAEAAALAALRAFNYERIYVRPASLAQSSAVVDVLRALVDFYIGGPSCSLIRCRRAVRPRPWIAR
jgi:dGTPase